MADKFVLTQLLPGEEIKYEYSSRQASVIWYSDVTWIATNKRIIKYVKEPFIGRSFQDLDYKHIISIDLIEKRNPWLLIISIFLAMLGIGIQFQIIYFSTAKELGLVDILKIVSYLFIFIAIILAILAVFLKVTYCKFNASSIRKEEWIVIGIDLQHLQEFMRVI